MTDTGFPWEIVSHPFLPGPFAEANRLYRERYAQAHGGSEFVGKLRQCDDYDGEDNWCGESFDLTLDEPRGDIVMLDVLDILRRFDGKRVRLTITEL